jgi:acetoin utilization deacetylase AcuC-like enzyme
MVPFIPVYYVPAMVADSESFSPSAAKPASVVASWLRRFPIEIRQPEPVERTDFYRAHDRHMVDGILEMRVANGFGNRSAAVASSLPFTSGAMLCAAREALANACVACAPVSGFHHAGHAYCGLYCTFNGLMVTALALKAEGMVERIGILDFDNHYGDGTDSIVKALGIDWITHFSAGRSYSHPQQAAEFLSNIPGIVSRFAGCDLLLYQAGADPHIDDELGGWLTTKEMRLRDRRVFQSALALNIPVAWNLAGGYQHPIDKVVALHDATMAECCAAYVASETITECPSPAGACSEPAIADTDAKEAA